MPDTDTALDIDRSNNLLDQLQHHPHLLARIQSIVEIVNNSSGDLVKADQAELRLVEELRLLGQQALQAWAERKHHSIETDCDKRSDLTRKEKKSSIGIASLER